MSIVIALLVIGALSATFLAIYHFILSHKINKDDTIKMLREKGIGDRPENIVKNYYKIQNKNLDEKEVRSLTKQFIDNNKEFFLTMFDQIKKHKKERGNNNDAS